MTLLGVFLCFSLSIVLFSSYPHNNRFSLSHRSPRKTYLTNWGCSFFKVLSLFEFLCGGSREREWKIWSWVLVVVEKKITLKQRKTKSLCLLFCGGFWKSRRLNKIIKKVSFLLSLSLSYFFYWSWFFYWKSLSSLVLKN